MHMSREREGGSNDCRISLLHLVGTLNKASSLLYFAFAGSGRVGIVAGAGVGIMIAFAKKM